MRIWDVPPAELCRAHLLGEHRELHALWSILTQERTGYARHPETMRWRGKLNALFRRHEQLVEEMARRGYKHATPLDLALANGSDVQNFLLETLEDQRAMLRAKRCGCCSATSAPRRG